MSTASVYNIVIENNISFANQTVGTVLTVGTGGAGEFVSPSSIAGSGGISFPFIYSMNSQIINPSFDLDVSSIGDYLFEFTIDDTTIINSIILPSSNMLSTVNFYGVYLFTDLEFNFNNYPILNKFNLSSCNGIKLLNLENATSLVELQIEEYGRTSSIGVPTSTTASIPNLDSFLSLRNISYYDNRSISHYGNVSNSPVFEDFYMQSCQSVESIGNFINLAAGDSIYITYNNNNMITPTDFRIGNFTNVPLYGIDLFNNVNYGQITIENNVGLTAVGSFTNVGTGSNNYLTISNNDSLMEVGSFDVCNLNELEIIYNSSLTSIGDITNCNISWMDCSNNNNLLTIGSLNNTISSQYQLNNCALTSTAVSQILTDLDNNGNSGSSLNIDGGSNAGLGSLTFGTASYYNLIGKGWTININA